ncbi:MAG TPA: SDR family oxidoreductase [Candidatus Saccharimonadia bacterium]|nr:SDR family oxidoreductase [Candidatus Saccharimonadia bacterium]
MRTIVITGGSDGLGKTLALRLSKENKVIILARNEAALQEVAKQTGCDYFVCDVRDAKQVAATFAQIQVKHPTIDVLINNAGITVNGDFTETSDEDIESVMATNTLGTIFAAKAALKLMKQQQRGLIVNVNSQSGLTTKANRSIYNASKWAVTGFTKAMQEEAAAYGVRVTGFYPGTIHTQLFAKAGLPLRGIALTTEQAARAIEFVIDVGDDVLIPELGMKRI